MAIQGADLVLVARGVSNGSSVNPADQPALADGIHLRFGFDRDRGFPWYGYYIFRRLSAASKPICSHPPMRAQFKTGSSAWLAPHGEFSATGAGLVLDEAFEPSNRTEFDLRNSPRLDFKLGVGRAAREFRVTLGFYGGSRENSTTTSDKIETPLEDRSGCLSILTNLLKRWLGNKAKAAGPFLVTAWSRGVQVASAEVSGLPGTSATVTLNGDCLDQVAVAPKTGAHGGCALIEVCHVPVDAELGSGWEPLRDFTYPLCLPNAQPSYPCAGRPADAVEALALARSRVRYGLVSDWDAGRFDDMTVFLDSLLTGGPVGGPMATRCSTMAAQGAAPDDPSMPSVYPLDMLLFGSLHPAVAQVLGLYWIDESAAHGIAYDYIVLADHDDSFGGSPQTALETLVTGALPAEVDAYITFNAKKGPAVALAPPDDLRCYALPGGVVASMTAAIPVGTNTVGLTWSLPNGPDGDLLPGGAIYYHLWRNDHLSAAPAAQAPPGTLLTADTPILVADTEASQAGSVPAVADWPPFRILAYDRHLPDGWYSYRLAGVDLFGQFTEMSAPAQWHQWQPIPDPRPWYYIGGAPGMDAVVNPWAVELRDTTPPPPPTGVEAYALDPDDPLLIKDTAFGVWMSAGWWTQVALQATRIGVRVKWRWTASQQIQAPDTAEFRLYFHLGSTLPGVDGRQPSDWDARIFAVGYGEHVSIDPATGDRHYDVLLPVEGDGSFAGLPLQPDNAHAVVYGHIGVSAADNVSTTPDHIKWQTAQAWQPSAVGDRDGNESRMAVPAKIYRVLRTPPPAPTLTDASERVWASRADYHGMSYHTFRWPKPSGADLELIDAHIFGAMDQSLFAFDLAQRPRASLDPTVLDVFPAGWDAAAITAELDGLNDQAGSSATSAMPAYRALSDRALRVLASIPAEPGPGGKPGNDGAFRQITHAPLKHADVAQADRIGPDDAPTQVLNAGLCAFKAQLNGRARNRYLFRAAYVNGAHQQSALGPSSPPVYLHKVEPPRTPAITRILGGDRQITVTFASNREEDLVEYRIYRADTERQASDIRLMTLVGVVPETVADPGLRPNERTYVDGVPAGIGLTYRMTAIDSAGNVSRPSPAVSARGFDLALPAAPQWVSGEWVMFDPAAQTSLPWPMSGEVPAPYSAAVRLELTSATDICVIERRSDGERAWIGVTQAPPINGLMVVFVTDVSASDPMQYRARALNRMDVTSPWSPALTVEAAQGE